MIIMIDNYDSFTYNLVQYLQELGQKVVVYRNDAVAVDAADALNPDALVISPGPGRPETAGISIAAILHFAGKIPILGVCLGHQAIVTAYGGRVVRAQKLMHGKTSMVTADGELIYKGITKPFTAMRYHSLAAAPQEVPGCLKITATAEDGEIMGVRHQEHMIEGIQFHPESIMTRVGKRLLRNFINFKE